MKRGELCADGVKKIVLIENRFRVDADVGVRGEDRLEPTCLWRGAASSPRHRIAMRHGARGIDTTATVKSVNGYFILVSLSARPF